MQLVLLYLLATCWVSFLVKVIVSPIQPEQSRTRALSISIFGQVHGDKGYLSHFKARISILDVLIELLYYVSNNEYSCCYLSSVKNVRNRTAKDQGILLQRLIMRKRNQYS